MALHASIGRDAVTIINEWGDDVSFDGGTAVKGVLTETSLTPDQPGFSALSFGGRGSARRAKLEIVSSDDVPSTVQKVTISGVDYKVEGFLRRTWITEVDLVRIEAV